MIIAYSVHTFDRIVGCMRRSNATARWPPIFCTGIGYTTTAGHLRTVLRVFCGPRAHAAVCGVD